MSFTAQGIYPLAHRLHTLLSEQRTFGDRSEAARHRDHLVEALMSACDEMGLPIDVGRDPSAATPAVILTETLASVVTGVACPYRNLASEVEYATEVLVEALGSKVEATGGDMIPVGTPIPVAAIAALIGYVTDLKVPEA
jgi:hypothetical protein